ncbi:uncharacterized protein LOC123876960 isoform X2 [Maniola jurtina]|uniref:uncharacterized protein LOC123876960 isoform X2 n=1 Tax=Maniola jurtina TaxID=191418 RepID=UPI001E68614A|nr:uncharacterized protein LOC123876960 isoform X2 [Maniola jurtina]
MRGGLLGSLCFLAFLLSSGTKGQNVLNSQDLQASKSDARADTEPDLEQKTDDSNDKSAQDEIDLKYSDAHADSVNPGNSTRPNWAVPPWGSNTYTEGGNAQALANAQASEYTAGNNPGHGYPSSNPVDAYADANALANAGGGFPYGSSGFMSGTVQDESELNSYAQAVAENLSERKELDIDDAPDEESRMGGGFSFNGDFTAAVSRKVPQNEIIQPDLMPGGLNLIKCTRETEIHTLWAPALQCLVCVCVRDGWALRSKCVRCSSCANRPPPPPPPPPPSPIPTPSPPLIPEPQVSCSPLPSNTPFENPLNPCQTCICQNIINAFGQVDVQIKCEENPICVTPPGFIPIPPPPEPPIPQPMPLCESLPINVQFPHPTENCKICRCVVEMTPYLIPERRMLCEPDIDCETIRKVPVLPTPPLPPPQPPLPPPMPPVTEFPIIPYPTPPQPPLPPITPPTDIDPVPWPPVVPPMPRPPSPLPGPPPHETCRPYPPNTPFQHPWDECQICICSEIYGTNVVNIEVNCYTKKSCCIEPPIPEPAPALPYLRNLIFIEPKCRYHSPNEPYVVDCNICVCETVFQYVYAKCTPQPNCGQSPQYYGQMGLIPGSSVDASAAAFAKTSGIGYPQGQASGSVMADTFASSGSQYPFIGSPSSYSSVDASANAQSSNRYPFVNSYPYTTGQTSAQAQAEAFANAQSGNENLYPYSNSYTYSEGGQSSAQAQAEALATPQSSLMSPYPVYPYSSSGQSSALAESETLAQSSNYGQSSAQAQAEAFANAQSGNVNLYPYSNSYTYSSGGQSSAQAQAEALATPQSSLMSPYPVYSYSSSGQSSALAESETLAQSSNYGQSSAQAQAEAFANAQSGNVNLYPYSNSYTYSSGGQSSAQAQAEALATPQSSLMSPYPVYSYSSSGQSSALAESETLAQSSNYGQSSAQAQAEAFTNAQSGNVNLYPYSNSYPYSEGGQSSAQTQAEALANAQSSLMSPYTVYPYSSRGQSSALAESEALAQSSNYGQSSAQAQAEALAQSGGLSLYGAPYGGTYGDLYSPGQSQSSAQAEASANTQILGNLGASQYGINQLYPGGQSTAQEQAEALTNAQSQTLDFPYGNYFGGSQAGAQAQAESISAAQLYPSMYPYPTTNIGQLYQPGVNGWDSTGQSQAQAQAQADVLSQSSLFGGSSASAESEAIAQGSATAQSLAQSAALSGRPLIKSGKGLCKYSGDQYHHNCQACYCLAEASGKIYTLCLGNPCA